MFEGIRLEPNNAAVSASADALLEKANTAFTLDIEVQAMQAFVKGTDYSNNPKKAFEYFDIEHPTT